MIVTIFLKTFVQLTDLHTALLVGHGQSYSTIFYFFFALIGHNQPTLPTHGKVNLLIFIPKTNCHQSYLHLTNIADISQFYVFMNRKNQNLLVRESTNFRHFHCFFGSGNWHLSRIEYTWPPLSPRLSVLQNKLNTRASKIKYCTYNLASQCKCFQLLY